MLGFPKRQRQPIPPWVKWGMMIFAAYALILHFQSSPPGEEAKKAKSWFNSLVLNLDTVNQRMGSGPGAICGQEVAVRYEGKLPDGAIFLSNQQTSEPFRFRLGAGDVIQGWEQGVVGMKAGGVRTIRIPARLAYDAPGRSRPDVPQGTPVEIQVMLEEMRPPLPASLPALREFITERGKGTKLACGETALVSLIVTTPEGKPYYASEQPVKLKTGTLPLGLEIALQDLRVGDAKTLLLTPAYMKSLEGATADLPFALPKDKALLIDLTLLGTE